MTNYFVRPNSGGNDANAGTSQGAAWRTINAATAAILAPGDFVRIEQTPAKADTGKTGAFNGTGTNAQKRVVTLSAAVTKEVFNCESAFTASTNVTTGTSTNRRQGSNSSTFNIASGFTTGKIGFVAIQGGGTQDFSAYQQLSFYIFNGSAGNIPASNIKLCLCSDTNGDTIVDEFPIAEIIPNTSTFTTQVIDKGAALGASIQSVALYAIVGDLGTFSDIRLDHIFAVKSVASADSLSLNSLIGKAGATEELYSVESIIGTTITLAGDNVTTLNTSQGYVGATETVALYKTEPFVTTPFATGTSTIVQEFKDSGTAASLITFSGGWNTSDMTSQVGETYFTGSNCRGSGLYATSKSHIKIEKLFATRYYEGIDISGTNIRFEDVGASCCADNGFNANGAVNEPVFAGRFVCIGNSALGFSYTTGRRPRFTSTANIKVYSNTGQGISLVSGLKWLDCSPQAIFDIQNNGGSSPLAVPGKYGICTLKYNASNGANFSGLGPYDVQSINTQSNTSDGISLSATLFKCRSYTSSSNASGRSVGGTPANWFDWFFGNFITSEGVKFSAQTDYVNSRIKTSNEAAVSGDDRKRYDRGNVVAEFSDRYVASGRAWRAQVRNDICDENYPLIVGEENWRVYATAGSLVTITVALKRTHADIKGQLKILAGRCGLTADVVTPIAGAAGSYAVYTATFTPSSAGFVEFVVEVWTTNSNITDDLLVDAVTVAQA